MNRAAIHETPTGGETLYAEVRKELDEILHYWQRFSPDREKGGFAGALTHLNKPVPGAEKGAVLNARILWTFSAAWPVTRNVIHLDLATRAFQYIRDHFNDSESGGLFWSVQADGQPSDTRKQVYAQAFGIYGMSEYYRATGNKTALELAVEWFRLIDKYSLDPQFGGYMDAFDRDWSFLEDKRLSAKDDNAVKTMNTHLHVIEAYANLYEVWPDPLLKTRIFDLLTIFDERILNRQTHHLGLFFDEQWIEKPGLVSYGHDIEAGWLLQSCALSVHAGDWISRTKKNALLITDAAMEGLDEDGGLWYERNRETGQLVKEKHWWPQAEALIGFCNAWQVSGNAVYHEALLRNWAFIKKHIRDQENGEWRWGVREDYSPIDQHKVGLWKCPYHNSRACIQLIKRVGSLPPAR